VKRVCVFCGASCGSRLSYRRAAEAVALELVRRGLELVYGGGDRGLMGIVSSTVRLRGGRVLGIIPEALMDRELVPDESRRKEHQELMIVGSMHDRKARMEEAADAFVALPGGLGTLEEVVEVLSWGQLGLHRKPIGLLQVDGYYDSLLAFFDRAVADGFLMPEHEELVTVETDAGRLLDRLAAPREWPGPRWLRRSEQT
jgi:uncharacterized protein (TIGR00730 family)